MLLTILSGSVLVVSGGLQSQGKKKNWQNKPYKQAKYKRLQTEVAELYQRLLAAEKEEIVLLFI